MAVLYKEGLTYFWSKLKTLLNGKQNNITGSASTITTSNLTANRALISNGSGKVAVSSVTSTELGYLDGVTSNVQTQLSGKAASSHTHTISQVTDLQSTLNGKANSSHTHTSAQVTDLQGKLDGKANSSHTHTASQITDLGGKYIYVGNKVEYDSDATSYTLPGSSIVGALIPCQIYLGSSAKTRTIKAPSGGQYIISGFYVGERENKGNSTSLFSGGATVVSGYMVGVKGFYMRIL